jgi:hypothetical protein
MIQASYRKNKSYPDGRDSSSSQQSRYGQQQPQNLIFEQCRFYIQGGQQASLDQASEQDQAAANDREHLIDRG